MELSFSAGAKTEMCKAALSRQCCALAEAYGVLLFSNTFTFESIKTVTGNRAFAERLPKLFRKAFGFSFDEIKVSRAAKGKTGFEINSPEKIKAVFESYGYDLQRSLAHRVNLGVLEESCCQTAFARGAFLAGGSAADPNSRYHLELMTAHYNVSRDIEVLFREMGFDFKASQRKGNYVMYLKKSEAIEDFLTMVGAPVAAMDIMSTKVEKELRNEVNRRVNCDTANVGKTVEAVMEQIEAINKLDLEKLTDKLRETAQMRMENPEVSLSELAAMFDPPVTKSCLNHRLRKIVALASEK